MLSLFLCIWYVIVGLVLFVYPAAEIKEALNFRARLRSLKFEQMKSVISGFSTPPSHGAFIVFGYGGALLILSSLYLGANASRFR